MIVLLRSLKVSWLKLVSNDSPWLILVLEIYDDHNTENLQNLETQDADSPKTFGNAPDWPQRLYWKNDVLRFFGSQPRSNTILENLQKDMGLATGQESSAAHSAQKNLPFEGVDYLTSPFWRDNEENIEMHVFIFRLSFRKRIWL